MPEHPLSTMKKLDPALAERIASGEDFVFADGALPRKTKILMAMAFDAAHGAMGGVRSLAAHAMEAGASKEEIAEALRVAWLLSGIGSVYVASQALKDVIGE